MVWNGTFIQNGFNANLIYTMDWNTITADGDDPTHLDILNAQIIGANRQNPYQWIPQNANFYLTSAHATAVTDVVDIKLQGSVDNTNWDDLCAITSADFGAGGTTTGYSDVISATAFPTKAYRYFKVLVTTVGAGNTLHCYAQLW